MLSTVEVLILWSGQDKKGDHLQYWTYLSVHENPQGLHAISCTQRESGGVEPNVVSIDIGNQQALTEYRDEIKNSQTDLLIFLQIE